MGQLAADAFESNPNVLNAYDKQRINQGQLTATNLSWGVQSLGTYRGVVLYVYEAEYEDVDSVMKRFVPASFSFLLGVEISNDFLSIVLYCETERLTVLG